MPDPQMSDEEFHKWLDLYQTFGACQELGQISIPEASGNIPQILETRVGDANEAHWNAAEALELETPQDRRSPPTSVPPIPL